VAGEAVFPRSNGASVGLDPVRLAGIDSLAWIYSATTTAPVHLHHAKISVTLLAKLEHVIGPAREGSVRFVLAGWTTTVLRWENHPQGRFRNRTSPSELSVSPGSHHCPLPNQGCLRAPSLLHLAQEVTGHANRRSEHPARFIRPGLNLHLELPSLGIKSKQALLRCGG